MTDLKGLLEYTDCTEHFIAICEALIEFSKHYRRAFDAQFTDIVDIVIGWHIDLGQPDSLRRYCTRLFQLFAPYFYNQLNFTYNLLGQFIEDIDGCSEAIFKEVNAVRILNAENENELIVMPTLNAYLKKREIDKQICSFTSAFTAILKALMIAEKNQTEQQRLYPPNSVNVTMNILGYGERRRLIIERGFQSIYLAACECLKAMIFNEMTITSINEFLTFLILQAEQYMIQLDYPKIEDIIRIQIEHIRSFNGIEISALLYLILIIVRQYKTQLPVHFVGLIMRINIIDVITIENNNVNNSEDANNSKSYQLLLKVYHEVLMIKNVPLLQEAYYHIRRDIELNIQLFRSQLQNNDHQSCETVDNGKNFMKIASEIKLNFYLSALAVLATQTSSIISNYALNPSILELLVNHYQADDESLWSLSPTLHEALIELIQVHCTKNYNFCRSSSILLKSQQQQLNTVINSPTSENFGHILQFLMRIISWYKSKNLLEWLEQIIDDCRKYADVLVQCTKFISLCRIIIPLALRYPLMYGRVLQLLIKYQRLPTAISLEIRDICLCLLSTYDTAIIEQYTMILSRIPIDICLIQNQDNHLLTKYLQQCKKLLQQQRTQTVETTKSFRNVRTKTFQLFIENMEPFLNNQRLNQEQSNTEIITVHHKFFQNYGDSMEIDTAYNKGEALINFRNPNYSLITNHLCYELAQYCVHNKLRTTLGKPQETLHAIEIILNEYARLLDEPDYLPLNLRDLRAGATSSIMHIQQNSRILLKFIECLEKHVYNAADGTAYAMLSAEKPAKTFFRVNESTCREWFKRQRNALNVIALNSFAPEVVIRNAEVGNNTSK